MANKSEANGKFSVSSVEWTVSGNAMPKRVTPFESLKDAAKYVRDRWMGVHYVDGPSAFHTDCVGYELDGFTLHDIGEFYRDDDGFREYSFSNFAVPKGCIEDNPDC